MTQDVDIQLQAWKDLAINKQVLMNTVTKALELDTNCSPQELQAELDKLIQRANQNDTHLVAVREQADEELSEMRAQLKAAQLAQKEAETKLEASEKARAAAEHQLTAGKADNAEALKKAKAEVAKKQKELKAINKLLADTPENVVKKLRQLKKQKTEETNAKNDIEKKLQTLRKDFSKLNAEHDTQKSLVAKAADLATKYSELHAICSDAAKNSDEFEVPALDEEWLGTFKVEEEKEEANGKK